MHASTPGLRPRLALAWSGTILVAGALAFALGGAPAGAAVVVVGALGWLLAGRGVAAELGGFEALADAVDAEVAGTRSLGAVDAGEAGRTARAIAGLVDRARVAEDDAREALQRTLALLDATPSGVVVVAPDGRVEHVNDAVSELLELQRDPVGLRPLEGLHAVEVADAIEEAQRGRDARPRDVAVAERDLSISAHPLEGGGVLALLRDVSDERLVERARTDFVANVSHELRTPIAAILGFAETLLDTPGGLQGEVGTIGRAIHRNAQRLRQLFEDLLTLHRVETRRHELPRSDVLLEPLLAEALGAAADTAANKGIGFALEVPERLEARANAAALAAIVANLAGNACKYTASGGRIDVRAEATDDGVRIDVRDTGIGIPRTHQARVFERFYRVDEGRARSVGGTGLGLAIAKHLAEATGCRISLQSEEGRGSTFSVHVPRNTPRTPRA